jgi:N-carbamoylputrescine amidase
MRIVRIATTSFLIEDTPHTVAMNIERGLAYIDEAKKKGADIVCLPETFPTLNLPEDHPLEAENYPGEWTKTIGKKAGGRKINVIAPYYVRVGKRVYNQTTVFNRKGKIVGYYRKIQPTAAESKFIAYDSKFPVFKMDFGKIAVMICMDIYFPEIPRIYGFKGAEILFWPTVSHGPTQAALETQLKARALDNSLILVESNLAGHPPYAPYSGRWCPGTARIIDHNGDVIAQTGRRHGIAVADVDLDEIRLTSQCVLIREPDHMREDLASITRMDLYGREYLKIAKRQKRYY